MKAKLIIAIAALAVVAAAAAAGGAMWYTSTTAGAAVAAKPAPETKLTKYVTLDKVIVMLRRAPAEQATHYLSVDLVLATTAADEKATKEQLPLLRSIAVSALSARTMAEASAMTVDQYAAELNKVFNANYAKENHIKPFSEVMVGKLIIE
jgi:flagellar FliL protein